MDKFVKHLQMMEGFVAQFAEVPALFLKESLDQDDLLQGPSARQRLYRLLETAKRQYHGDRVKWITYVLALVIACPPVLKQEGEFGWVREELLAILMQRYLGQKAGIFRSNQEGEEKGKLYAQDFWVAWRSVAKALTSKGRPLESGRHFAIANEVWRLMAEKGLSKDAAVVKLGERLKDAGLSRGDSQRDQIYESLRFVQESGYWSESDDETFPYSWFTGVEGQQAIDHLSLTPDKKILRLETSDSPSDQSSENIIEERKRNQKGKSNLSSKD